MSTTSGHESEAQHHTWNSVEASCTGFTFDHDEACHFDSGGSASGPIFIEHEN